MKGVDISNLDTNIAPADDFYLYACGGWKRNHPLEGEYARFGTFDLLREKNRTQLHDLITGLADTPESKVCGSVAQKVADLFALGMDADRLNAEGAAPLRPQLERIEAMTSADFTDTVAWMHYGISSVFFSTGVGPDPQDSRTNIMHIGEGGLGLGDRDYYLEDTEENLRIRTAYRKYIYRIMELCGFDAGACARTVESVLKIETAMARIKKTREQRRDPMLRSNPRTLEQVRAICPDIDWTAYFAAVGVEAPATLNVSSTGYFDGLSPLLRSLTEREIKDYMAFSAATEGSGLLSDDFVDANFEMYSRTMAGIEEQEPRWKRAMSIPNSMLGEAVGELYTSRYFPEEAKTYMTGLVERLRSALATHIADLPWMSADTRRGALHKLEALRVKIGYPDKWKDYSSIEIDPSRSYLENVLEASRWYVRDNYRRLGKPVDRDEWLMTPQTVNAYYNPTSNEICFPAGILQPPYFDLAADHALNYGAIGVVIGHEMTHGFDDQGRHFDSDGNLADWWKADDAVRFNALADRLAEQFDSIEVAPGVHANGRFTLGENIADQGGLRVAMTAYRRVMEEEGHHDIDGFTPEQRFYLAYASVWADNIRHEEILLRTKTDPHSLGRWRVNGTLPNLTPFLSAFGITEGSPMYRPESDRVVIW